MCRVASCDFRLACSCRCRCRCNATQPVAPACCVCSVHQVGRYGRYSQYRTLEVGLLALACTGLLLCYAVTNLTSITPIPKHTKGARKPRAWTMISHHLLLLTYYCLTKTESGGYICKFARRLVEKGAWQMTFMLVYCAHTTSLSGASQIVANITRAGRSTSGIHDTIAGHCSLVKRDNGKSEPLPGQTCTRWVENQVAKFGHLPTA